MIKQLINEFKNMDSLPIIEIETLEDGWNYYTINISETSLWCQGVNNVISIDLDECFSLDEHLQYLYEYIIEDLLNNGFSI